MNWQQKLQALQQLTDTYLRMRSPGDWYISAAYRDVSRDDGIFLNSSSSSGRGRTPKEAVENDWRKLVTELPLGGYVVLNAWMLNRRHLRWNGTAWIDLKVSKKIT